MRAIFISYRRDDSEGEAGRLFDDLVRHFGEDSVFMDVAAIEAGRDFRKAIDESVATCGVLLAVISNNWLDAKDGAGRRRLDDPADFVRLETASALRRDIPVIPVLVRGVKMPRPEQLPDDLKDLAYRNGVELTHARWPSDLQVLIRALEAVLRAPGRPEAAEAGASKIPVTDRVGPVPGPAENVARETPGSPVPSRGGSKAKWVATAVGLIAVLSGLGYGGYYVATERQKQAAEEARRSAEAQAASQRADAQRAELAQKMAEVEKAAAKLAADKAAADKAAADKAEADRAEAERRRLVADAAARKAAADKAAADKAEADRLREAEATRRAAADKAAADKAAADRAEAERREAAEAARRAAAAKAEADRARDEQRRIGEPPSRPTPRPPSAAGTVLVPDVTKNTTRDAVSALERAGLQPLLRESDIARGPVGTVVSQRPAAGTPVDRGKGVTLVAPAAPPSADPAGNFITGLIWSSAETDTELRLRVSYTYRGDKGDSGVVIYAFPLTADERGFPGLERTEQPVAVGTGSADLKVVRKPGGALITSKLLRVCMVNKERRVPVFCRTYAFGKVWG